MRVSVSGKVSKSLSKKLRHAAKFFADLLMDPRMVNDLNIKIKVGKKLELCGVCEVLEEGKTDRNFRLEILNDGAEDPIETLAHEMVHVKQYAKKELGEDVVIASRGSKQQVLTKWKGEFWKPKSKEDPYYDSPWEIEAFGRSFGLYERWTTAFKNKRKMAAKRKPINKPRKKTKKRR